MSSAPSGGGLLDPSAAPAEPEYVPDPRARRRVSDFVREGLLAGLVAAVVNAAVVVLATATGHQPLVNPGEAWSKGAVPLSPIAAAGATVLSGLLAGVLAGAAARLIRRPVSLVAMGGAAVTAVSLTATLQTPTSEGRAVLVACHLIAGTVITTTLVREARRAAGR